MLRLLVNTVARLTPGSSSSGPNYRPLNADAAREHMRDIGMRSNSNLEMERRPMLRESDQDDHDEYHHDVEAARPGVYQKVLSWRPRRRQPIFITTLWVTASAALIVIGAYWAFNKAFPGHDQLPSFEEPQAVEDVMQNTDNRLDIENDATHVLVPITASLPDPVQLLPPMDNRPPLDLLVQYYTTGTLPEEIHLPPRTLDLVYLFVNASSPYFQAAREKTLEAANAKLKKGKERHWRDNGELRGSVRSGAMSLAGRVSRIHIVSAAFEVDEAVQAQLPHDEGVEGWRMGQIPNWLDWNNKSNVNWHFHSDIFRLPRDDDGRLDSTIEGTDEAKWREAAMPTFNSFQIESRLGWLNDLSEEFVYSNDDMFLLRELSSGDFHHPLFGSVFRLDPGLDVKPYVTSAHRTDSGEWGGLSYASKLLSQRFPHRNRIYMHHMPKAMRKSIVHEASIMFAAELTESAMRPFRESAIGVADIEMAWLATHLQMERWREALLWVWAVARVGDLNGVWGEEARNELRSVLKLTAGHENGAKPIFDSTKGGRDTIDDFENLSAQAAWEMPEASKILYSSFDGHMGAAPYSDEEWKLKKLQQSKTGKAVQVRPPPPETCTFDVDKCIPTGFWDNADVSSADMFKHFAFEKPACGDCLIEALVVASRAKGLRAFLPSASKVYTPPPRAARMWDRSEPMLPLTNTWEAADYSLANNVRVGQDEWAKLVDDKPKGEGGVNLLDWSVKLLSRYAYVYGQTPSRFAMVHGTYQLHNIFKTLDSNKNLAMACINDDQPDVSKAHIRVQFQNWMKKKFGGESKFVQWEKEGVEWDDKD